MIDLHTHTIFSDGALIPAELVRHAEIAGYEAIALTDHVDSGNMEVILKQCMMVAKDLSRTWIRRPTYSGAALKMKSPNGRRSCRSSESRSIERP